MDETLIMGMIKITFLTPFRDTNTQKQFDEDLKKIMNKETKQKTLNSNTSEKTKHSDGNMFRFSISKKNIFISYTGSDKQNALAKHDNTLNRIITFINVSECKIKTMRVNFSKTFNTKKFKISDFFDKSALVNFNTQMKKTFTPVGGIFSMKLEDSKDGEVSLMFIEGNKDVMIDITVDKIVSEKTDWDILIRNDKIVNDLKKDVFKTLGVS